MRTSIVMFLGARSSRSVLGGLFGWSTGHARWSNLAAQTFFSSMASSQDSNNESSSKYYTVGITGSSGLVGTALRDELSRRKQVNGKPVRVVRLLRDTTPEPKQRLPEAAETELRYNPSGTTAEEVMDPQAAKELDAVVHLAGENVASGMGPLWFLGRWTTEKKAEILNSRVIPTKALSKVVAATPQPMSFFVASGVGVYGNNFIGPECQPVDESMDISSTSGFLAEVSRQWEAATEDAKTDKNRVVSMRFGVVLSIKGGALGKLYPIFYLGGGGVVGSGEQYFSFISARDHAGAIVHTLENPELQGPVNFCSPEPCTNKEFTKALGEVLHRPTILPLPSFAVKLIFGEMGEEMLLGGVRAKPSKLTMSGFQFEHPTIKQAIDSAINEDI